MKIHVYGLAVVLSALISFSAWASPEPEALKKAVESVFSCSNFIRYDDAYVYEGSGSTNPAQVQVIPLADRESAFRLTTQTAAFDTFRDGDSLFVLTAGGIEEWDLNARSRTAVYPTLATGNISDSYDLPEAFAHSGNTVIIAHGRQGLSFFDLKSKRITHQIRLMPEQYPLESSATGVSIQGKYAYISMDSITLVPDGQPQPFRGLVIVDMDTQTVVSQLDGMDVGADAVTSDSSKLIVSFGGIPIWKYRLGDLRGSSLPEPEMRLAAIVDDGYPTGRPAMDSKYYYTCFLKSIQGGKYARVPRALDRAQTHLN